MTDFFRQFSLPILYVLGNHEYFGGRWPDREWDSAVGLTRELLAKESPHVHLLENDQAVIGGVRFLGATLWTDMISPSGRPCGPAAQSELPDYEHIRKGKGFLAWQDTVERHRESLSWLLEKLESPVGLPTVVVTHHAPSARSNPPAFADSPITGAFCNRLDRFVREHPVAIWIHGHTHRSSRYEIGETLVLSNPGGFFDGNPEFDPFAGLDLEDFAPSRS
ncbi:MAG: metallophosphoesterase [Leptospirales bacterium]